MSALLPTLALPLLTAAAGALRGPRRLKEGVLIAGLAGTFVLTLATARESLRGATPSAFGTALRVDGLSALVLVLSGFAGLVCGSYGIGYLRRNEGRGLVTPGRRREFHALLPAYVFALLLVPVSNNLGVLWIAMELTTLASVFLVAFHNRDTSLEAAWKFLVLGSLGLAFALLGTVLLFASGRGTLGEGASALDWTRLLAAAPHLHPFTVKLAVIFLMIGYGTKAGLAPMHTWKPDAYREAPSPAGALMAIGMLNGALYCLLRVHIVSRAALGPAFSGDLLLWLGLLSVMVATPFMLVQWNLKRLLAYSSIEHVGIMAVGLGLGPGPATYGALLHLVYHTLAKPVAFFAAGTLAQLHRSSDIETIGGGTLSRTPVATVLLLTGAAMMTGTPPFGLFFSEFIVLRAGLSGPHAVLTAGVLASLVLLFCGFFYQVGRVALGPQPDGGLGAEERSDAAPMGSSAGIHSRRELPNAEHLDLAMGTALAVAAAAIVSAFYLPGPLLALLHAAVAVVEGRA